MIVTYTLGQWLSRCRRMGIEEATAEPSIVRRDAATVTADNRHPAYPRPQLGNMVASALSAVGITKDRVSRAIGKPCGCAKRQEALNALGRRLGIG